MCLKSNQVFSLFVFTLEYPEKPCNAISSLEIRAHGWNAHYHCWLIVQLLFHELSSTHMSLENYQNEPEMLKENFLNKMVVASNKMVGRTKIMIHFLLISQTSSV